MRKRKLINFYFYNMFVANAMENLNTWLIHSIENFISRRIINLQYKLVKELEQYE